VRDDRDKNSEEVFIFSVIFSFPARFKRCGSRWQRTYKITGNYALLVALIKTKQKTTTMFVMYLNLWWHLLP